jgi:hypothetical protein
VSLEARKLEPHAHDQSSIKDNFQTAIDALRDCNVVEYRRVETTCEGAY